MQLKTGDYLYNLWHLPESLHKKVQQHAFELKSMPKTHGSQPLLYHGCVDKEGEHSITDKITTEKIKEALINEIFFNE